MDDAVADAINYRCVELGETLEQAARNVKEALRRRGITVDIHVSTDPAAPARLPDGAAVFEVHG